MSHKFTPLFLINNIDFSQIDFIIIFKNVSLRFTYSSDLSDSSYILANKSTRAAFSHPTLSNRRLVSILIYSKIRIIRIKLLILDTVRIYFIICALFYSQATHS